MADEDSGEDSVPALVDIDALQARLTALRSEDENLQAQVRALQRRLATLRAATRPQVEGPARSRYALFLAGFAIASPIGWMLARLLVG